MPSGEAGTKNEIIVLGLDPSIRATGYGLVRESSGQAALLACGVIRPPVKAEMAARLACVFKKVSELITTYCPHEAAIENVFHAKNTASALTLGQARGAAMTACAMQGLCVAGYEPSVVKKTLVGTGRAEKTQVAFMVAQILGKTPAWFQAQPSDATDALGIAICHLNHRRFERLAKACK